MEGERRAGGRGERGGKERRAGRRVGAKAGDQFFSTEVVMPVHGVVM